MFYGPRYQQIKAVQRATTPYELERAVLIRDANYRVAWSQDDGYFAQGKCGEDEWVTLTGNRYSSHVAAVVDAKLYAGNVVGEACRLHPDIANLTRRT